MKHTCTSTPRPLFFWPCFAVCDCVQMCCVCRQNLGGAGKAGPHSAPGIYAEIFVGGELQHIRKWHQFTVQTQYPIQQWEETKIMIHLHQYQKNENDTTSSSARWAAVHCRLGFESEVPMLEDSLSAVQKHACFLRHSTHRKARTCAVSLGFKMLQHVRAEPDHCLPVCVY